MTLRDVLGDAARDPPPVEVTALAYDNRLATTGTLFFCVPGFTRDGHDFARDAVARGASALVVQRPLGLGVPEIVVDDVRAAMAPAAARLAGDPTARLRTVGITGTNGKTTTAFLVRALLEAGGMPTGLLGTVGAIVGGARREGVRTTPEAIDLQRTFAEMVDAGDRAVVMEVSSHALALPRAAAIHWDVAVFTNLTQDHLDFHAGMEDYFAAKRQLFLPGDGAQTTPGVAVVNVDDPYGARIAADLAEAGEPPLRTFSPSGAERADYRALEASFDASGSRFRCVWPAGEVQVRTPLAGHFNIENALAAIAACHALDVPVEAAAAALADAGRAPGRFEPVEVGQAFAVLVDYAHTPDSLENVLRAARLLTQGRLVCVFGCGGDRDRDKRPKMGEIAARLADRCVVTSDNPRSEDPNAIIAEILAGIPGYANGDGFQDIAVEPDRRAAIASALEDALPGDTVVIAGKGHEQGQEFENGRKIPFDDRTVAAELLTQGAAR